MVFAYRTAAVLAAQAVAAHRAWAARLPTDAVFAPDSFWHAAIPRTVPLHADSAAFVQEFRHQKQTYYGNVNLNTGDYASPTDVVGPEVLAPR